MRLITTLHIDKLDAVAFVEAANGIQKLLYLRVREAVLSGEDMPGFCEAFSRKISAFRIFEALEVQESSRVFDAYAFEVVA